ncbi:MAG TPA: M12 family metallo-peptidase [Pyrinomonadaceae bacterium]
MKRFCVVVLLLFGCFLIPDLFKTSASSSRNSTRATTTATGISRDQSSSTTQSDAIWKLNSLNNKTTFNGRTKSGALFTLNKNALANALAKAPKEFSSAAKYSLSLPTPEGQLTDFAIEESSVMEPELAQRFPDIKSYRGKGIQDPNLTVRFDWSPLGFHAVVLSDSSVVSILPANADNETYLSFYDDPIAQECSVVGLNQSTPEPKLQAVATGPTLRNYRIAVAADHEYCESLGGDTLAGTVASINAFLNGVNAIYERELSVHLNLVNNTNIIYSADNNVCSGGPCTNNNDPYTNGTTATMLNEARADLANKVGMANYDLGHVLGTNSGGQAFLRVVCNGSDIKGGAASGMFAPAGNSSSVGLWAHEIGHQFGANHTFNGTNGSCGSFLGSDQRNSSTAWETGSGITIMSYAGSCSTDNIVNARALRFHAGSIAEMNNFIASATCNMSQWTATGNSAPTVDTGPIYTIPRNTPFTLTAHGSDPDASDQPNLTYVWEQADAGGPNFANPPYIDAGDPLNTTRPIFRSFSPVNVSERTFPSWTYILNNANTPPATIGGLQTAENLPQTSRALDFLATVRDMRGGVTNGPLLVNVDGNSGPFLVTAPNGGETWSGARAITWAVNNTNNGPVGVSNVKITLSLDGGNSFPITLASSVPNSGMASVNLPNGIVSSTARIKVEALGNIFFDVSDANFTLTPSDTCPVVSNLVSNAGRVGDNVLINGLNFTNAGSVNSVNFANGVSAPFSVLDDTRISTTVPAGATTGPITLGKSGCGGSITPVFVICSGGSESLAIDSGTANTAWSIGNAYYANRLTPSTYPATLNEVSVYFASFTNVPAGTPITIIAGGISGAGTNFVATNTVKVNTTVGALNQFDSYKIPSIKINSGDFVVGLFVAAGPNTFPASTSNNSTTGRSYLSADGVNFSQFPFQNGVGNFMIRGRVIGDCGEPPIVRTLTVDSWRPTNGLPIVVSPVDNNGLADEVSKFTRTYNNNTVVTLTAPSVSGANAFQKWQRDGVDWSTSVSTNVTMDLDHTMTAVYAPVPVQITVQSNPAGRTISIDGGPVLTAPQVVQWIPGSAHSIATTSPQAGTTGTQFVFTSWSDGGAISHNVTAPATNTTYTANFTTQFLLTTQVAGTGGTVQPASGFIDSGQSVQITAVPTSGFTFLKWTGSGSGSFTGTTNPVSVVMNGPITESAAFSPISTIRFASGSGSVSEGGTQITVTVTRAFTLSNATVDYATSDSGSPVPCENVSGNASARCDYLTTLGTLTFTPGEGSKTITIPIVDDSYAEGPETFSITLTNATGGAQLGTPATETITINDNETVNGSNPIDTAGSFVRQHYIDFLNREPDANGLAFWTNEFTSCGPNTQCIEAKRINVSAAFFLSIEFQETGYLVYRTYKTAFGNLSNGPVPVSFTPFLRDTQRIGQGVVVGQGNWQTQLELNKQAFMQAFVQRADFQSAFPNSLTATQFVDQLNTKAGGVLSEAERNNLIASLTNPGDSAQRATTLRAVAEDADLRNAEFNKAFVLMQYFGYLRRSPNELPDSDYSGFNFWLGKLDQFNGNYVEAEMIKAFITSGEYRRHLGP